MDEIAKGIHQVYDTREKYIIIGLTGRTGSGCTTTGEILATPREKFKLVQPQILGNNENETRKFSIIKRFLEYNWEPFLIIEIKNIITSFILESTKEDFIKYVSEYLEPTNGQKREKIIESFFKECGSEYDIRRQERLELQKRNITDIEERHKRNKKFYFEDLPPFTEKLKKSLDNLFSKSYTKVFQKIGDNIRSSGSAISDQFSAENIFAISKRVNRLLKIFTSQSRHTGTKTYIVIDTLRNPFEALYFRERYSAFYLMALNTVDLTRKERLQRQYDLSVTEILNIDKKESNKVKSYFSDFVSQNIQKCYDLDDIHVSNPQLGADDFSYLNCNSVHLNI